MQTLTLLLALACADLPCAEIQTQDGVPIASCLDGMLTEYISLCCDDPVVLTVHIERPE